LFYPVYYPVGNGMRNIELVIEDLKYILNNNNINVEKEGFDNMTTSRKK